MLPGAPINFPGVGIPHPGYTPAGSGIVPIHPVLTGGVPAPPLPGSPGSPGAPGVPGTGAAPLPHAPGTGAAPIPGAPGSAPAPGSVYGLLTGGDVGHALPRVAETTPDELTAHTVAEHLASAISAAKDPLLKESLSTALAAIHKHLAGVQKERHQALKGMVSPRMLEQTYGPAHQQAAQGNYAQAIQTWEQHHPYAVTHGHIPGFISQWLSHIQNPAATTSAPANGPTAY